MRKYCEECGREVETRIVRKQECYQVCGEPIEVVADVLVCEECGEEFYCEELDNATLVRAYNEYRRRHKLLLPEEIRAIREKYGLSQRSFAKLLNWGDKTIFRYENGSVQDKVHNSMLLFLREPENMRTYLRENEIALTPKQQQKLMDVLDSLSDSTIYQRQVYNYVFSPKDKLCEENGYRAFDFDKFSAMVLFFAHKNVELLKTKLMKLLNYADMIFYKENGISISGARYIHLPYGPVPERFDLLLGMMSEENIAHIDVEYDNGYEKHRVMPEKDMPQGVLSETEIAVLERIHERFLHFGSVEISNYSHKEKGYVETKKGEVISYAYAKDIELN